MNKNYLSFKPDGPFEDLFVIDCLSNHPFFRPSVRFGVITALTMKNAVFQCATPFSADVSRESDTQKVGFFERPIISAKQHGVARTRHSVCLFIHPSIRHLIRTFKILNALIVCMCTYTCVRSYVFVRLFVDTYLFMCVCVCVCVCMYVCMYVYMCICTYVCIYVCMYYVCMYVCMYVLCCTYVCLYVCTCVCMYVCLYVCMYYVCMYVCLFYVLSIIVIICMHVRMYLFMRVFIYLFVHICIYACMYACIYLFIYACIYVLCMYSCFRHSRYAHMYPSYRCASCVHTHFVCTEATTTLWRRVSGTTC